MQFPMFHSNQSLYNKTTNKSPRTKIY